MNTLQYNLKKVRSNLGLTQKEISSKLEISTNTYNGYESQGKQPNAGFIKNFCSTFNVSADWLLGINANNADLPLSVADVYFFIERLKKKNVYCDSFSLSINPEVAPKTVNSITIVLEDQDLYKFYQTDKLIHKSEGLYFNDDEYKDWYENNINKLSGRELEGNRYNDAYKKMFNDLSENYYMAVDVEKLLKEPLFNHFDDKIYSFNFPYWTQQENGNLSLPDEDNNKQDDNEQDDD